MAEPFVATKGILQNASMAGKCYNDDALFGATVANMTVDDAKALSCDKALIWAKTKGITEHPAFYKNYTLYANSSYVDFQCALYHMKGGDEAGTGWNCSYPCTSTLPECPPPVGEKDLGIETTTAASSSSSSSLPLFAWILMGLALLGIIGGLAYYFMVMKKEAPKKKKRAVKKATPAPAPPAAPEPKVEATPVITAPPVYVTQAVTAAPVMMATPVTTYSMATPTYAAQMVYPTSSVAVPTAMPAYSTMA